MNENLNIINKESGILYCNNKNILNNLIFTKKDEKNYAFVLGDIMKVNYKLKNQ